MSTTVIVPVFQRMEVLSAFTDSLQHTIRRGTEVIFVNDGSGEHVGEALSRVSKSLDRKGHSARVISNDSPRGCGQALNQGLAVASGDFLVFADSDLVLTHGWQESLESTTRAIAPSTGERAGMASSVLLYPQTGGIQHAGIRFSGGNSRHWKLNSTPAALGGSVLEVQVAAFALFAMTRSVAEMVGSVDEQYLNGYEDFDYQLRAREFGYRTLIDPKQHSFHWERRNGPHRFTNRKSNLARLWRRWGDKLADDLTQPIASIVHSSSEAVGATRVVDLVESRVEATAIRAATARINPVLEWVDQSGQVGDGEDLDLLLIVPHEVSRQEGLVVIVENFVQLTGNHLWFEMRRQSGFIDTYVDLYGNELSGEELMRLSYPGRKVR